MDAATVMGLAELARLDLSADEAADCAEQLGRFLAHAAELSRVEVERGDAERVAVRGRPPTPLRADVVTGQDGQADAVAGSPQQHEGFFVVPRVLE